MNGHVLHSWLPAPLELVAASFELVVAPLIAIFTFISVFAPLLTILFIFVLVVLVTWHGVELYREPSFIFVSQLPVFNAKHLAPLLTLLISR